MPSDQRLLGLALGTIANIRMEDGKTFSVQDFVAAVLASVRSDETALRKAVNDVSEAMYNRVGTGPLPAPRPPGEPGPDGAPFAPAIVTASFAFCGNSNQSPVSIFNVNWSPSANATVYGGYSRFPEDFGFKLDATYPAPQTSATFTVVGPSGQGRIAACNSFGCSGLSQSSVDLANQCLGF